MIQTATVIVYKDKAFIPTQGLVPEGPYYLSLEPVITTSLEKPDLSRALQVSYESGNPIAEVSGQEYHKSDPILKATKARSWKQLARAGVSYGISWHEEKIVVYMSKVDDKGRFVNDPEREQELHADTSIEKIAQVILDDFRSQCFN